MSNLVVIVGETASGKSALAMELAHRFNGEIICADSRTVYKGMDIGTAKPSLEDQNQIPHHLIDIIEPDEPFTVSDFQALAIKAIADISQRGKLPIMVGGTGLYVDSVLYNFAFKPAGDQSVRQQLNELSVEELQARIVAAGYDLPNNPQNSRHLIRVIESEGQPDTKQMLRPDTLVIGITVEKEALHQRIEKRVQLMLAAGLQAEATNLASRYGLACRSLQTIGYQEFFDQPIRQDLKAIAAEIVLHTAQYAKRQRTWFKRNKSIHWVKEQIQAVDLVTTFLNKKN